MFPKKEEAESILEEAIPHNPGPWEIHSRLVAMCAGKIAEECNMDSEKAYVFGLLHDIGRRFGVKHLGHIYDGYQYMNRLGYDEVARICLTHSFQIQNLKDYIGRFDITEEEQKRLEQQLMQITYDDYDLLIQLCDSLATGERVVNIAERINDVEQRYGYYPPKKKEKIFELQTYFEGKMGKDLYSVILEYMVNTKETGEY